MVELYPVGHLLCLLGLFGLTFLLPNIIIIIFILKVRLKRPTAIAGDCDVTTKLIMLMQAMVISGSLALVDRGVLKHDEAVIHYRYLTAPLPTLMLKQKNQLMSSLFRNICAKIWRVYSRVFHAQVLSMTTMYHG